MDGHVHEDAARNLDVVHGLMVGVARGDLDDVGLAKTAGGDGVAHHFVIVVEAAHKADLQLDTCVLDCVECLLDFGQIGVDRLFTEDMLAGLGRAHNKVGVCVGGGADKDRFD